MSGNTGKMTAEAIRARGPRKWLACGRYNGKLVKVIYRADHPPFNSAPVLTVVASSYDTRYLLRIGAGV